MFRIILHLINIYHSLNLQCVHFTIDMPCKFSSCTSTCANFNKVFSSYNKVFSSYQTLLSEILHYRWRPTRDTLYLSLSEWVHNPNQKHFLEYIFFLGVFISSLSFPLPLKKKEREREPNAKMFLYSDHQLLWHYVTYLYCLKIYWRVGSKMFFLTICE